MFKGVTIGGFVVAMFLVACTPDSPTSSLTEAPPASTTATEPSTTSAPSATISTPASTSVTQDATPAIEDLQIVLTEVFVGFELPVLLVADPLGGADYVVEQGGRIVRADGAGNAVALDLTDRVKAKGEQGLLSLAFHPGFGDNGLAYVNYTDSAGRTVVDEFVVRGGSFDVSTRQMIVRIDQPAANHNGGMIAFGPLGHLWIGMGDGGASNDRFGNGQNSQTLLGAMLRISVPGTEGRPYDIPELNPYADGVDGRPEIYAIGIRNPWRFSFDFSPDGENADLWIADVGQDRVEEVNVIATTVSGANYGWPILEGSECFSADDCDRTGFVIPVTEYDHDAGCSITGGYVYRGIALPELDGHYFYGDFCSGFLRSYSPETGDWDWTEMTGFTQQLSGFGVGGDGEIYVVSRTGSIYRIERAG